MTTRTGTLMNESMIERDIRLRNEQDTRDMGTRLREIEVWQSAHEATCLGRHQAIISSQRLIIAGVIVSIVITIPSVWPHLWEMLGLVK